MHPLKCSRWHTGNENAAHRPSLCGDCDTALAAHPPGPKQQPTPPCLPWAKRLIWCNGQHSDVFGQAWSLLVERIRAEAVPERRLASLLMFARERLRDEVHLQRVRRAALLQQAALRAAAPADAASLSTRQFERVFAGTFGLTPKLFQRMARVEGLLRDAIATGTTGAALALRHGYYDQSHMARDQRMLAGASLSTLVEATRQRDSENWALAVGTAQ